MQEQTLSLKEISDRSGVEPRTLRSWASEGLLAPPLQSGRGARYPATNVQRALAVRALKDVHGLSLAEIGQRFMTASPADIDNWAREAAPASRGLARDYLRQLRLSDVVSRYSSPGEGRPEIFGPSSRAAMRKSAPEDERSSFPIVSSYKTMVRSHLYTRGASDDPPVRRRQDDLANIERLIILLESILGTSAPRRAHGKTWTRITVTRDLELSVRGELGPRERLLFEQLADHLRAILTGRNSSE